MHPVPKRDAPHYLVPDLSPRDRDALSGMKPRVIFVAESPHTSEIAPERLGERRPLCGAAGKKWWAALGEVLEGDSSEEVSLERMLRLCREHGIALLNAVQVPLDQAVTKKEPAADPLKTVGFCKNTGPHSYRRLKDSPTVRSAIESLRNRLETPGLEAVPIHCLGNDAEWFVRRALGDSPRIQGKIPHPSAWWRKGGHFGRVAKGALAQLLK